MNSDISMMPVCNDQNSGAWKADLIIASVAQLTRRHANFRSPNSVECGRANGSGVLSNCYGRIDQAGRDLPKR